MDKTQKYSLIGGIVGLLLLVAIIINGHIEHDHELMLLLNGAIAGAIVGIAISGMFSVIIRVRGTGSDDVISSVIAGMFVGAVFGTVVGTIIGIVIRMGMVTGVVVGMIGGAVIGMFVGMISFLIISVYIGGDDVLISAIFGIPFGATVGAIIGTGIIDNAMTTHPYLIFMAIVAIGYSSGMVYGMGLDEKSSIHKEKPFTKRHDKAAGQIDARNIRVNTKEINNKRIKSQNYAKGFEFEKYAISLFNEENWVIERVSSDVSEAVGRYVHSDSWPDLTIKNRRTGRRFSIECKYRSNFCTHRDCKQIRWAEEHQIRSYNKFQNKENHLVYVIIGVGGAPSKPERLFLLPLNSLRQPFVKEDYLSDFELSLNDENMIYIDWFR